MRPTAFPVQAVSWRIAETLENTARTGTDRVELALFKGRILAAEGDAFDLEEAHKQLGRAYGLTDDVPVSSRALALRRVIVKYRVAMDLYYEQDCETIAPFIEALEAWNLDGTPVANAEDREISKLIAEYEADCAP